MIDLPTFPMTVYHPIRGAVTVNTAEEAASLQPPHDFFKTPAEADAHRTEREAQDVIHNAVAVRVGVRREADEGVVLHSVAHQERIDRTVEAAEHAAAQSQPATPAPEAEG